MGGENWINDSENEDEDEDEDEDEGGCKKILWKKRVSEIIVIGLKLIYRLLFMFDCNLMVKLNRKSKSI